MYTKGCMLTERNNAGTANGAHNRGRVSVCVSEGNGPRKKTLFLRCLRWLYVLLHHLETFRKNGGNVFLSFFGPRSELLWRRDEAAWRQKTRAGDLQLNVKVGGTVLGMYIHGYGWAIFLPIIIELVDEKIPFYRGSLYIIQDASPPWVFIPLSPLGMAQGA